jgi:hypothetical protein
LGRDLTKSIASGMNNTGKVLATAGSCVTQNIGACDHWKSTYNGTTAESAHLERLVSKRPAWSTNRVAYSSSRCTYKTEFSETIGSWGHNPRDILPHDATVQKNGHNELTIGTLKVT